MIAYLDLSCAPGDRCRDRNRRDHNDRHATRSRDLGLGQQQQVGTPVQATLNAFVKTGGTSNDTIATAQDLTGTSFGLGTGGADRLAALGTFLGGATFGDALVVEGSDVILINQTSGHIEQTFTSPAFSGLVLFDVALAPDNTFYVLGDVNDFTGVIVHMDLQGNTLGSITLPVSDPGTFFSPEGFGLDPRDGSFWVPLANSASLLHVDAGGNFISLSPIGANPNDAAVGPDGKIYITQVESGEVSVFDPTTGTDSFFASSPFPLNLTWSVAGDLWVGDIDAGAEEFDSSGNLIFSIADGVDIAAEPALSGNIWDTNVSTVTVNQYTSSATLLTQTSYSPFQPGLAVLGDVPNEAPLPPPDNQDFYSFDLTKGQTATAVVESLNGAAAQISIVDGNGNVLATGVSGATNVSQAIENFVAPATGTFYVEITGDAGLQYSVAVTRGADFTLQPHNSLSTAQNITGTGGVLGYLAPPSAPLYVLDDQLYGAFNPIFPTDPATGVFTGPSIPAPGDPLNNPFGLNLAYDGTDLYYNDGQFDGNNEIYKLDPSTGAVLASVIPPSNVPLLSGLAYLDGLLYGTAGKGEGTATQLYVFDPTTLAYETTINTPITDSFLSGLTGDPDLGVLFAVGQVGSGVPGRLYEIDPATGNVLAEADDNNHGLNEQDMAYAGGVLLVSATGGLGDEGGTNVLQSYNPNTLAFIQSVPVATQGFVSGLGGDGLGGAPKDDWYSVNVQAGASLFIQSSTPSDQGGQFPNTASLEV